MRSAPSAAPLSDKDLMHAIGSQEDWALHELYDRYFRRAFTLAYRMLEDAAAAEDCVQDVFLKVWQQSYLYNPERGAFSSWLLTVVHHRAANHLRARRHVAPLPAPNFEGSEEASAADLLVDPAPSVEDQVWQAEQQRKVRTALADLAPAQRQALELAYYGGMTQAEIATHLNQPLGTIKTRMRSGLHKMRTALENLTDGI